MSSTPISNNSDTQKADQIAHRFFAKFANVVAHARVIAEQRSSKVDKWFNLETPDSDAFKDHLRLYRTISNSTSSTLPPLELQVLLTVPELTTNQVLVHLPESNPQQAPSSSSRVRVDPTPRLILLESWVLQFLPSPTPASSASSSARGIYAQPVPSEDRAVDVALPSVYKHGISLFRSLFTLLRVMPSWKLCKRFRRRTGGISRNNSSALGIEVRVRPASENYGDPGFLTFDKPLAPGALSLRTNEYIFPPLIHPSGTFSLSTTYLSEPNFQVDTLESLLSSRMFSDEGQDFTPTLARHSLSNTGLGASPGSLPMRMALPRSPPRGTGTGVGGPSMAERFVLPGPASGSQAPLHHQRTTSFPDSASSSPGTGGTGLASGVLGARQPGAGALPMTRAGNISADAVVAPSSHSGSGGGSPRLGALNSLPSAGGGGGSLESPASIAARLRRESLTGVRSSGGADLPSTPSPLPIRRPIISPIAPFKSGTLSSGSPSLHSPSPSLRQPSPLSGPSLPSRPGVPPSPSTRVPPSPISLPLGGERRSIDAGGGEDSPGPRRRYQSAFGHRYNSSVGTASDGSGGSADRKEAVERSPLGVGANTSFMGNNTDDDDISAFVQDIDSRKPLSKPGHEREALTISRAERRVSAPNLVGVSIGIGASPVTASPSLGTPSSSANLNPHQMTTHTQIESRLKELNDNFFASLEGLGSGGGNRRARSTSAGPARRAPLEASPSPSPMALAARREREHSFNRPGSVSGSEPPSQPRSRTTSFRGRMSPVLGLGLAGGGGVAGMRVASGGASPARAGFSGMAMMHGGDSVGSEEVLGRLDLDARSRRSSFRE